MMEIRIEGNNYINETDCVICGKEFTFDVVNPVLYDDDGFVWGVCPDCLKLTPGEMKKQFLQRIEEIDFLIDNLKSYRERYNRYIKEDINTPTFAEFEKAIKERRVEA